MSFQNSPVLPRICVGAARALYIGPGLALAPHVNVATTIAVSLAEDFSLRTWRRGKGWAQWRSCAVAVIPSETLHHLVSTGPMAFLYLDPLGDGRVPMSQDQLEQGRWRLIHAANAIDLHAAFAAFGLARTPPRDARIAKVVLEIERRPHEFHRLQDAAALAWAWRLMFPTRLRNGAKPPTGLVHASVSRPGISNHRSEHARRQR